MQEGRASWGTVWRAGFPTLGQPGPGLCPGFPVPAGQKPSVLGPSLSSAALQRTTVPTSGTREETVLRLSPPRQKTGYTRFLTQAPHSFSLGRVLLMKKISKRIV